MHNPSGNGLLAIIGGSGLYELPGLTDHPAYEQFKGMTLRQLQPMSGGVISEERITAVQAALDSAAPAPGSAPAAKPASK